MGQTPGPYINSKSRSIYARLGRKVAFLGVDARTERTRHQINLPETYDIMFKRLNDELSAAPEVKHLMLLLGVPIAYPRLVWLEMFLSSPILKIIRFLNKHFGVADGVFNKFDGKPDLADDLDDHYCARTHKVERNGLVRRLQEFSRERGVRISILSGDVHLAAVGRFYSVDKFNIPVEHDHRYMTNIISSAITNKPPPNAVANLLAKRNKVHHLEDETDEQLLEMFGKDVDGKDRSGNKVTQPRRNYTIITEGYGSGYEGFTAAVNGTNGINGETNGNSKKSKTKLNTRGKWEEGAGVDHPSAQAGISRDEDVLTGTDTLNVVIRVEVEKSDPSGKTTGYGFASKCLTTREGWNGRVRANNHDSTATVEGLATTHITKSLIGKLGSPA